MGGRKERKKEGRKGLRKKCKGGGKNTEVLCFVTI